MALIRKALQRKYCFVVLTGRRRIGKTRLVRESLRSMDHIDLFIPRKRLSLVLEGLSESIREQTGYSPSFRSMEEVFEYILIKEGKILFIDEISNLHRVDPGSLSDLQALFDAKKEEYGIHIIADGSYIGVMRRIFQDRRQPLFGRATEIMDLGPLPVKDSVRMVMETGMGFEDSLMATSILGGIPRYLELMDDYRDINDLMARMFDPGSVFLMEGENLLIQEFGASWDTYFSILEVISRGRPGPSSIASDLDMRVGMVPKYLKRLVKMRLVDVERCILGKKKQVGYRIADPFLELWFSVCYPRLDLYRDGTSRVSKEAMRTAIGRSMERSMRNLLRSPGTLPFDPDGIGRWWNRKGDEIDIVAYTKRSREILVGEVKWTGSPVGPSVVRDLVDRMGMIDWNNGRRKEHGLIVSRSGFTDRARSEMDSNHIVGIDLDNLRRTMIEDQGIPWL